jgi:Cd2+/Zn2+-exporting ATPase
MFQKHGISALEKSNKLKIMSDHLAEQPHVHVYDAQGRQLCCVGEAKTHEHHEHAHGHSHGHEHDHAGGVHWHEYRAAIFSFALLLSGLFLDNFLKTNWFAGWIRLGWYLAAYIPVGLPVLRDALRTARKGDVFSEFFLMGIATIGAFAIGQYAESVAVMLFYAVGELFQTAAVRRAKGNIKALLDVRPDKATVLRDGNFLEVKPETVQVGDTIRVRPGERVPLDGILLTQQSSFDTAALTGESKPRTLRQGDSVLAGMVNLDSLIEIKTSKPFGESSISRILHLVQHAAARKAPTELFIRKFARVYTPIVVLLAALLVIVPVFFTAEYSFSQWLYRALIFLVIACPCALVISIPLGYFGGIGAASRHGILFKGSNYLDAMTQVKTVVLDKTGTLTKGVFRVQKISPTKPSPEGEVFLLRVASALEQHSTHPVAVAIREYAKSLRVTQSHPDTVEGVKEIAGHGLVGRVENKEVLVGNTALLRKFDVAYPADLDKEADTIAAVAIEGKYAGHIVVADEIKPDAAEAVKKLQNAGVEKIALLSGDKNAVVQKVVNALGIEEGWGDLLPEGKLEKLEELKSQNLSGSVAFVGDGINDAPVLAAADVGIAMGGLGSDAAIETADVVIQTDEPSKVATAIHVSRATRQVVWQNISLAFGVKALVMALGAVGVATMWEAVFADVGVALLAILNAVRVQRMRF